MKTFIKYLPNILTSIRIISSPILLFIHFDSVIFIVIYLCCGLSDILDGFLARSFNIASKFGASLDSFADTIFFVILLAKFFIFFNINILIFIWCAIIIIMKMISLFCNYKKNNHLSFLSNWSNKLAGVAFYIYPMCLIITNEYIITSIILCVIITFAAIYECVMIIDTSKHLEKK